MDFVEFRVGVVEDAPLLVNLEPLLAEMAHPGELLELGHVPVNAGEITENDSRRR